MAVIWLRNATDDTASRRPHSQIVRCRPARDGFHDFLFGRHRGPQRFNLRKPSYFGM